MNLGKVVRVWERLKGSWIDMERLEELGRIDWMLDNAWEKLKKIKRDIDRLADFWKEWLDIGQCLVSFRGIGRILDRNVERLVEFWIDIDRLEEFGRIH